MAKLIFDEDNMICYLEEYAQTMTGPGVRWPGIGKEMSDEYLMARIRQEEMMPKKAMCNHCNNEFPSKSQMFLHLKLTQPDGKGRCIPMQQLMDENELAWVCLSLGYTNSDGVEDHIRQAFITLAKDQQSTTTSVDVDSRHGQYHRAGHSQQLPMLLQSS
jgi:hypothetical protein